MPDSKNNPITDLTKRDIFERLLNGATVLADDPQMGRLVIESFKTKELLLQINNASDPNEISRLLSRIMGKETQSVTVFTPIHINYGKHINLGKNVFINFDCTFLALGGITIEDDVLIGPKVSLITENHPLDPQQRKGLIGKPILIKKNAWIGANATILPGVTIGENTVIAAGAVVAKDVPDNTVAGGIPARIIKNQENMKNDKELDAIFPQGEKGSKDLFTGNAYNIGLVEADSTFTTAVGNVYFEPGARSNWHSHPAGQILIITDGVGYHQIEGQPIEILKKGSVVKCPPNVRHWHGASEDTGLQQLYIVPNTEKGIVDWNEAVTDEAYSNRQ